MIDTFLKIVAKDLYSKLGNNLSNIAVVFPNKRASIFFNEYLAQEAKQPIWSPVYFTISELFKNLSTLKAGDPIKLVCELYKIFCQETQSKDSLDEFYFWGELLINDFDDIDKNQVDADKLFSNLQNLKNILDEPDFLDEEQEHAIRQFFLNFSIEKRTQLKEKFISVWNVLGKIYHSYKSALASQHLAYEGMMYREAIEQINISQLPYDKYIFIGFNALTKVETDLFQMLQEADKALFYWDYDKFYLTPTHHEAGEFIRRNIKKFPSQLPDIGFDTLSQPKNIRFISSPTENAQAHFLPTWLKETLQEKELETAIVLCNEHLLLPTLHSIPPEVKNINITMGFPLAQTPVYNFIYALVELQTDGFNVSAGRYKYNSVLGVLKHSYCRQLSAYAQETEKDIIKNNRFYPTPSELQKDEFLSYVFTPQLNNLALCSYLINIIQNVAQIYQVEGEPHSDVFDQLYKESLFKSYTLIGRLATLIEAGDLRVNSATFKLLLYKILKQTHIPFEGEPAIGMQIMGILETRNLNFKNLIFLSLNEGQLPKNEGNSSFIPYNLRKAFGMTTIENRNAIYAYYFYRLLQRAENVALLYNTSSEGLNRGEWSRFMLQFLVEWPHPIRREYLEASQSLYPFSPIILAKDEKMMRSLQDRFDIRVNPRSKISPSALNTYLDCQLKFYYQYVVGLVSPEAVNMEIDSATFGSIFHRSAELAYKELVTMGKIIRKEDLEDLLRDEIKLQNLVDRAFKELFFNISPNEKPEYNGTQLIHSSVIICYLKQLLKNDLNYAPFSMEGMEIPIEENVEIHTPQGIIKTKLGGIIDRIDSKENILRIVDYKTGGSPKIPSDMESLFTPSDSRPSYVFQTFLYAAIVSRKENRAVAPSLLYIHRAASETYSPVIEIGPPRQSKIKITDFRKYENEFRERLRKLLEEIFDSNGTFNQTTVTKICEYCDFKELCKR